MDLFKLLLVFVAIVALLMRHVNLGAVMAGASLLLGLLFHLDGYGFARVVWTTLTGSTTLSLIPAVALIMVMEEILRREGILQRMVTAMRGLVGDPRVVMATLPALVGLIPSTGGAIFSAPMIDEVARDTRITPERKAFINYWYRHLWECLSPIYPSVLLAIQIFEKSLAPVLLLLLPLPVITALAGWPTAFRGLTFHRLRSRDPQLRRHLADLNAGLAPIVLVLAIVLTLRWEVSVAVALVIAGLLLLYRYTPVRLWGVVREGVSVNLLVQVAAVLLFKEMLLATRAVEMLAPWLATTNIPPAWLFVVLPLVIGILTGFPQAFVGTAAPVLVGLLGADAVTPAMVGILIVSGYGGVMLSPLHMCQVLTVSYFKADPGRVYRMVIVPELAVTLLGIAYLAFL
jgi:hypothetical protein